MWVQGRWAIWGFFFSSCEQITFWSITSSPSVSFKKMIITTLPSTLWPHLSRYIFHILHVQLLYSAIPMKGFAYLMCLFSNVITVFLSFVPVIPKANKNLDMSINASNNFNLNITWSVGSTGNSVQLLFFKIFSKQICLLTYFLELYNTKWARCYSFLVFQEKMVINLQTSKSFIIGPHDTNIYFNNSV